jgi:RNA polymerase-binding protein DksA
MHFLRHLDSREVINMLDEKSRHFEKIIKSKIEQTNGFIRKEPLFPECLIRDELKDEADMAEGLIQNDLKLTLIGSQRRNISALEKALIRLRTGTFGICHECEEPISEKRLMVKPESTLCIDCQEIMERKSRLQSRCLQSLNRSAAGNCSTTIYPALVDPFEPFPEADGKELNDPEEAVAKTCARRRGHLRTKNLMIFTLRSVLQLTDSKEE